MCSKVRNGKTNSVLLRGHLFSTYAKCSEKLRFLASRYAQVRTCAYQEERNLSFSENLYLLNGKLLHISLMESA